MNQKTFFLHPTTHYEIWKIIEKLKIKCGGVDFINARTIQVLRDFREYSQHFEKVIHIRFIYFLHKHNIR